MINALVELFGCLNVSTADIGPPPSQKRATKGYSIRRCANARGGGGLGGEAKAPGPQCWFAGHCPLALHSLSPQPPMLRISHPSARILASPDYFPTYLHGSGCSLASVGS